MTSFSDSHTVVAGGPNWEVHTDLREKRHHAPLAGDGLPLQGAHDDDEAVHLPECRLDEKGVPAVGGQELADDEAGRHGRVLAYAARCLPTA
jgi:hypothetical protein